MLPRPSAPDARMSHGAAHRPSACEIDPRPGWFSIGAPLDTSTFCLLGAPAAAASPSPVAAVPTCRRQTPVSLSLYTGASRSCSPEADQTRPTVLSVPEPAHDSRTAGKRRWVMRG